MRLDSLFCTGMLALSALFIGCTAAPDPSSDVEELEAGGEEAPIIGGSKATAYPEAVLIDMGMNGQVQSACSGALITPRVVLTAGHCIGSLNYWKVTLPFSGNQTATGKGQVLDYVSEANTVDPNTHDVGLIVLDKALSLQTYPAMANKPVPNGTKTQNIGRINNGSFSNTALFISQPIGVSDAKSSGFPFDYIADEVIQPGDSGGPVVVAGTHTIVAVNSGAGGGTQVLAKVDLVQAWIKQVVDANGGGAIFVDPNSSGPVDPEVPDDPPPSDGKGEAEPNNTYQQTNPLGKELKGELKSGDQDWFTWDVGSSGVKYNLQVKASGNAQIQQWKLVDGQYYKTTNTSKTQISQTSTGPGKYFVVVHSSSGAPQSYTVTLAR